MKNFTVNDVWDGYKIYPKKVSEWVASKMKSIASCIGVDLSCKGSDLTFVTHSKENEVTKSVPHRTPPPIRRQMEVCRLEFGMNLNLA